MQVCGRYGTGGGQPANRRSGGVRGLGDCRHAVWDVLGTSVLVRPPWAVHEHPQAGEASGLRPDVPPSASSRCVGDPLARAWWRLSIPVCLGAPAASEPGLRPSAESGGWWRIHQDRKERDTHASSNQVRHCRGGMCHRNTGSHDGPGLIPCGSARGAGTPSHADLVWRGALAGRRRDLHTTVGSDGGRTQGPVTVSAQIPAQSVRVAFDTSPVPGRPCGGWITPSAWAARP